MTPEKRYRPMKGLVDCNNFFVSCERSVDPSLEGKCVVVMSNNDGCVVARSNEAKRLGVKMGQPVFQLKDLINSGRLTAISGHHLLYREISHAVHRIFREEAPETLDYSVDEAFLDVAGMTEGMMRSMGRKIYERCLAEQRIPVTVGFAPTFTLAKICTEICKKAGEPLGLLLTERQRRYALEHLEIGDLWGIGRRLAKRLYIQGIRTAADFADTPMASIRADYGVNGERTWLELHGTPAITLDHVRRERQDSIMESRTFPEDVDDYSYLQSRIAMYTEHVAQKLRAMKAECRLLTVMLRTNRFREGQPLQAPQLTVEFDRPTSDTSLMIRGAIAALDRIVRPGVPYKRGGVMISEITPAGAQLPSLFDSSEQVLDARRRKRLMDVVDTLSSKGIRVSPASAIAVHSHAKSNDGYSSSFRFR